MGHAEEIMRIMKREKAIETAPLLRVQGYVLLMILAAQAHREENY